MSGEKEPDPRVEAAARAMHEPPEGATSTLWDDLPSAWKIVKLERAAKVLAAADKVDPLRDPDTHVRFPALAAELNACLDELIGIADDWTGVRVVEEA